MFQPGDRVRHAARPQWGIGRVERAERLAHEGRVVQRVTVTFPHHGRVTVNTAFAPLEPAQPVTELRENPQPMPDSTVPVSSRILESLKSLPQQATDPLSTLASRLKATLDLYRYSTESRSLLEWAIAQTALDDPLSHLNRHELEQAFGFFALNRDRHLKTLVLAARKAGKQEAIHQTLHQLPPQARDSVARALRGI
jgi:hypothetical protein